MPEIGTSRTEIGVLKARADQVRVKGSSKAFGCDRKSAAGSVTQRACAFCGSRVVLYPIADALHVVHGPIGCAVYNWDIRGSLSSGPQLHRNSFSTDLGEKDVVFGGEPKLERMLLRLIEAQKPKAAFVYSTCIVGVIGDDVEAVCRKVTRTTGVDCVPVDSPGFKGTKKSGYHAACEAAFRLVGTGDLPPAPTNPLSINLLGEFNIAGEAWMIREYFERMGVEVVATLTGDGRVDDLRRCHQAKLNLVQCSGSMNHLARLLEEKHGIPSQRVSFFGFQDTARALYGVADFFGDSALLARTQALVRAELERHATKLRGVRRRLQGKKAAIYVGGAFKALSLVEALRALGMQTVLAGTQTGSREDYRQLESVCDPGTVIVDDSNPLELAKFILEQDVDLFVGGVKERPVAYKLGVAFCDHNHERKIPLAGFEGMVHFANEVCRSVTSPIWSLAPRRNPGTRPAPSLPSPTDRVGDRRIA